MSAVLARAIGFSLDPDGIGWITFDTPESRANVFDEPAQEALDLALDEAGRSTARAVVIRSGKDRIFIAGADLRRLQALPDAAAAERFSRRGQQLFQRVADLPVPVICAIHGACAGGGYELALACDHRLASDAPVTQIGLPEVGIGTIPGWGGCARLPRLIGPAAALAHILEARLLPAESAARQGLVDEVVPAAELLARAKVVAMRLAAEGKPGGASRRDSAVADGFVRATGNAVRPSSAAAAAAIEAVEHGYRVPLDQAFRIEAALFGAVTAGEACKDLIHVFFLREAGRKRSLAGWFPNADLPKATPAVRRVGVVGAGVMGSGIAHWLAARGLDVVVRDVTPAAVERGLDVVRALADDALKRGKTTAAERDAVLGRIRTTTAWDGFGDRDVVIEAIVENVEAKRALFSELAGVVRSDTVLASNTSALPIEEIAGHVPNPDRILGIHFFNPVSRMPLVELIVAPTTSARTAATALQLVLGLGKSPVICRSSPGFFVTRVLFFYLNAAVARWEAGVPVAEIDAAMRDFGWPMGPLRLIDEVGLDVTAFIFAELEHYYGERFTATRSCARLDQAGLKGRKNGAGRGFYRYDSKPEQVNDAETRLAAGVSPTPATGENIAAGLMRVMVTEARACVHEGVVKSPDDADFALLTGAGFPPFRGGLLRWADRAGL